MQRGRGQGVPGDVLGSEDFPSEGSGDRDLELQRERERQEERLRRRAVGAGPSPSATAFGVPTGSSTAHGSGGASWSQTSRSVPQFSAPVSRASSWFAGGHTGPFGAPPAQPASPFGPPAAAFSSGAGGGVAAAWNDGASSSGNATPVLREAVASRSTRERRGPAHHDPVDDDGRPTDGDEPVSPDAESPSVEVDDMVGIAPVDTHSVDASPEGMVAAAGAGAPTPMRARALDLSNMTRFITEPTPDEVGVVQCYIERDKAGFGSHPVYSLYLREGDRFLLAAKKRSGQRTSNYVISDDRRDLSRHGEHFRGKVRSNWLGTEFIAYDNGLAPGDKEGGPRRAELALIHYAPNMFGSRGPRKMNVCIPRVDPRTNHRVDFRPTKDSESMADFLQTGRMDNLVQLINKPPKWNHQVQAHVLNFNGRVTMASVKNFQLVPPDDHERVVVQFGRVGKDLFTMDYQWPASPLQAFAICISSFDYKLACE